MIRIASTLLLTLISSLSFAQEDQGTSDTLSSLRLAYGYTQVTTVQNGDTSVYTYFPDGNLESIRPIKNGVYNRYYKNGALMWEQELEGNKANGQMRFYSEAGKHLGTLGMKNDTIVDTIYLNKDHAFVFGHFTYSSKVYGGMRRPDGSSNVSSSKGDKMFAAMFAVKHDKAELATKYCEFSTDLRGLFFFEVEEGSYGVFPEYQKIEDVTKDMGAPRGRGGNSGVHTDWSITGPIKISDNFCYLSLHVNSIGYAP